MKIVAASKRRLKYAAYYREKKKPFIKIEQNIL